MVCLRCIKVVKDEFEKLKIPIEHIELGKVITQSELCEEEKQAIEKVLTQNGFELIDDKKDRLIENIKALIIKKVHHSKDHIQSINSSDYISSKLGYDYSYLSNLFSSTEGITIEKYIINQKIEKVKELLIYDELSLNEISHLLNYSSVQHLSKQFKKVTGTTPSQFKKLQHQNRKPLDEV